MLYNILKSTQLGNVMLYGIETRKHIINRINKGENYVFVARSMGVHPRTVQAWLHELRNGRGIEPKTNNPRKGKIDKEELKKYVTENNDLTLKEIARHFGVWHSAIERQLKRFGFIRKKKATLYKERSEIKREKFKEKIKDIPIKSIVHIDEAGVDNRLFREYCRCKKGQKIIANIPGKKRERINIIGGLLGRKKFIAPFIFKGKCNAERFNHWLKQVLLPRLARGTTIIMDNATFHKTSKTKELIEKMGCKLLYLPPYSPDLNPIEHWWYKIKSILKPLVPNCDDLQSLVEKCVFQT